MLREKNGWLGRAAQCRRLEDEEVLPINTQVLNLHETLSSITSAKCETCLECFPNLPGSSQPNGVIECRRCAQDRHIPKLFSNGNMMDPGTVPTQLQVYLFSLLFHIIIIIIIIRDCHRQRKF